MDPDEDAYGQAIRDYHERAEGFEIISVDRSSMWVAVPVDMGCTHSDRATT